MYSNGKLVLAAILGGALLAGQAQATSIPSAAAPISEHAAKENFADGKIALKIKLPSGETMTTGPVANNDYYFLPCHAVLQATVLANDSDPNGNYPLTITGFDFVYANGYAIINMGEDNTYLQIEAATGNTTPAYGGIVLTYTVQNSLGQTATTDVTIGTECAPGNETW